MPQNRPRQQEKCIGTALRHSPRKQGQNGSRPVQCTKFDPQNFPLGFEKAEPGPAASAQEAFMRKNFDMSQGYLRNIPFYY